MTGADGRSTLVVVAAEAEPVVGDWRLRYQRAAVERCIPARYRPTATRDTSVVPHCTIGTDDDPARPDVTMRELREGLFPRLPIRCRADEVVLFEEEPDGTWARREAFSLDGA